MKGNKDSHEACADKRDSRTLKLTRGSQQALVSVLLLVALNNLVHSKVLSPNGCTQIRE